MSKYLIPVILLLAVFGCKTPEARKPVEVKSGSHIQESAERNKEMIAIEEEEILAIIEEDSLRDYRVSEHGFWYYYEKQNPEETHYPEFGDIIEYEYDLKDLEGNTIYTKEELGIQRYHMEKEELISGLREGLKLMKEGETATFIFPSYKVYGYYGDLMRIGANMPLKSTITVHSVKQIN